VAAQPPGGTQVNSLPPSGTVTFTIDNGMGSPVTVPANGNVTLTELFGLAAGRTRSPLPIVATVITSPSARAALTVVADT
jgi:hypothetical protein